MAFYMDPGMYTSSDKHRLAKLVHDFMEPEDCSPAVERTLRLVGILLLSNRLAQAHSILCSLYQNRPALGNGKSQYYLRKGAFTYFWCVNGEAYARPVGAEEEGRDVEGIARAQWGKYREACRTGWMLEHCKLPEPESPHVWRTSSSPAMLAMCARLLAKNKLEMSYKNPAPLAYPPDEVAAEALDAGLKLYAMKEGEDYKERHCYLLYKRLVVELAIKAGRLDDAVRIMVQGLARDGIDSHGATLDDFLFVPGIYEVLPLLAKLGKEGNPYHIDEEDANTIVEEVTRTIELRAAKGRQWSLAPGKLSWEELLGRLARGAWTVNKTDYIKAGIESADAILFEPATEVEIKRAEERVGPLPEDFKAMVRVANGFAGGGHLFGGGIAGIRDIRLASDIDDYIFDRLYPNGDIEILENDIIELRAGAECDGFRHYLVRPEVWKPNVEGKVCEDAYLYWHDASWRDTPTGWESVWHYVASCVEEVEDMVERGRVMKNSIEIQMAAAPKGSGSANKNDMGGQATDIEDEDWEKVEAAGIGALNGKSMK